MHKRMSPHGDYDHMGEAINLVNSFKVLDKKKIKYYSCVKELNVDKNKLYFLQTKEYDNENYNSNVIYKKINGISLCLWAMHL